VDEGAIRNLAVRYSLAIDDGRFDEVAALFAPDATFAARYGEPLQGREAIAEFLEANAAAQVASHHAVQGHLIAADGDSGAAVGIVQVAAVLDKGGETLRFALRCHDRYRLVEDRWVFAHRGIAVRFAEADPADPQWSLGGALAAVDPPRDEETRYVIEQLAANR
jgi:uncharacterized protein (TIGR02246 family)